MHTTAVLFQIHYFDRWAERAFRALRAYARRTHYRLSDLARAVVEGTVDVEEVAQLDAG